MKQKRSGFWFQITHEERDEWRRLATERGMTVSQLIRVAVAEKLRRLHPKQKGEVAA